MAWSALIALLEELFKGRKLTNQELGSPFGPCSDLMRW